MGGEAGGRAVAMSAPPKRRVTAYDVARRAGVSQSAVSRSLNPGGSASPELRARVEAAAKALGYRPNAIARAMNTRRSGLVAVILSNETNLHFPEVLTELVQAFSAGDMQVLLFTIEGDADVDAVIDRVWAYQVDGIVAAAWLSAAHIDQFAEVGVPVLIYNRAPQQGRASAVGCDHRGSGAMLGDLLLAAGHRRFALIHGPRVSPVSDERLGGVRDRLRTAGVTDVIEADGDFGYESGRRAVGGLARAGPLVDTAIVAASDWMALGALDALRHDLGLEAPRDVSVAGFDGVAPAAWSSYRLTTMRQPVRDMARAAAAMLLASRGAPSPFAERRLFSGVLMIGGSTRAAPGGGEAG